MCATHIEHQLLIALSFTLFFDYIALCAWLSTEHTHVQLLQKPEHVARRRHSSRWHAICICGALLAAGWKIVNLIGYTVLNKAPNTQMNTREAQR